MAYKWHHIVVSIFCICALAFILSSLVGTFHSIQSMKRKRKRDVDNVVTKQSVNSEDDYERFGGANVMEMNRLQVPVKHAVEDDLNVGLGNDIMDDHVRYLAPISQQKSPNNLKETVVHNNKKKVRTPGMGKQNMKVASEKTASTSTNNGSYEFVRVAKPNITTPKARNISNQQKQQRSTTTTVKPSLTHQQTKQPLSATVNYQIKFDHGVEVPVFPHDYHASGLLLLPRSGIAEPFEIWYASSVDKSRIDYYYGTDKTFQRGDEGDYGVAYKYVPMYNDVNKSFDGCWLVRGREQRRIVPQIITPNITWFQFPAQLNGPMLIFPLDPIRSADHMQSGMLTLERLDDNYNFPARVSESSLLFPNPSLHYDWLYFQYNKTEVYTGTLATKWTYEYSAYGMKNYQSVWITKAKPHRPIRYEMLGFDMMLGSYYDNYVIEYISFDEWDGVQNVFRVPKHITCYEWGNSLEDSFLVNPMKEFTAFSADSAINHTRRYNEFKTKHYKADLKSSESEHLRKHVFKDNARYINSHNRKNLPFKLKPNQFTDKLDEELSIYHTSLEKDPKNHTGEKPAERIDTKIQSSLHPQSDVPEELDWRDFGAVSSVKGQGICGACYAFSASEAAEGAWYRKTSKRPDLSNQQLIDCSWGIGNHGCKGGHYAGALSWIYMHGISTAKSYGKYLGQEGYCHFNDTWFGANIDGFTYVPIWNKTALKRAIAMHGPVAISINTKPLSFKFYSHGIYNDPLCVKNETTHSALVVGYGKQNGREYWIIKNSWSDLWGESGFMRISMDNDLCGVTEYPVAVIVNHPSFVFPQTKPVSEKATPKVTNKQTTKQPIIYNNQIKNEKPKPTSMRLKPKQTDLELKISKVDSDASSNESEDDVDTEEDPEGTNDNSNVDQSSTSKKTIPFSGLHISSLNDDLKKFRQLFNDDSPDVFDGFNFETIDETKNKLKTGVKKTNNIFSTNTPTKIVDFKTNNVNNDVKISSSNGVTQNKNLPSKGSSTIKHSNSNAYTSNKNINKMKPKMKHINHTIDLHNNNINEKKKLSPKVGTSNNNQKGNLQNMNNNQNDFKSISNNNNNNNINNNNINNNNINYNNMNMNKIFKLSPKLGNNNINSNFNSNNNMNINKIKNVASTNNKNPTNINNNNNKIFNANNNKLINSNNPKNNNNNNKIFNANNNKLIDNNNLKNNNNNNKISNANNNKLINNNNNNNNNLHNNNNNNNNNFYNNKMNNSNNLHNNNNKNNMSKNKNKNNNNLHNNKNNKNNNKNFNTNSNNNIVNKLNNTKVSPQMPNKSPPDIPFDQMTKEQVNQLLSLQPIPFQKMTIQQVQKLSSVKPKKKEKKTNKQVKKKAEKSARGKKGKSKKSVKSKSTTRENGKSLKDRQLLENLMETDEIHKLLNSLDDPEISHGNTSSSKEIKTHKTSKDMKLNPESIGSLDIEKHTKPLPMKATLSGTKKDKMISMEISNKSNKSKSISIK